MKSRIVEIVDIVSLEMKSLGENLTSWNRHFIVFAQHVRSEGSRGVPWVPWNPSFEGLPSKILCANIYVNYAHTRATHFSFTVAITHVCPLNNFLYQEFDARMTYVHIYTTRSTWQPQRQWAKRESELKQRFYSCIDPTEARVGDMLSVCERFFSPRHMRITSCYAASVTRSGVTLWFCGLQTQQLGLVVGRPTFAISPQEYTRKDFRRSLNFPGGHAPRSL